MNKNFNKTFYIYLDKKKISLNITKCLSNTYHFAIPKMFEGSEENSNE